MNRQARDKIRQRTDAATEGPWKVKQGVLKVFVYSTDEREEFGLSMQNIHWRDGGPTRSQENAEFIAHARTDLPTALDECDRLERMVGILAKALDDACETVPDDKPAEVSALGMSPKAWIAYAAWKQEQKA